MKVRASVKKICEHCIVVVRRINKNACKRRKGKRSRGATVRNVRIKCPRNPRHNQRQG